MAQVRVTPSGNLDKDGELSYISNGNYVDANDIRHRQSVGNNFGGIMGTNGNSNLITLVNGSAGTTLPAIGTTTKLYRIYLDYSYITSGSVGSYTGTLVLIRPSTGAVLTTTGTYTHTPGNDLEDLVVQIRAGFNGLHASFSPGSFTMTPGGAPYYTSTGTDTGYFTMTTTGENDFEVRIDLADSNIKWAKVVLEREYVATATTLRPIGSYQLEDYLFVWSASESSSGTKSDISEIGVIYSTNQGISYQYKTLCRSRNLGFFKERRIDAQVERVGNQINFYWTDGNKNPRAMYLEYSKVTTQNGFMYWEGGRYELNSIDEEALFFFKVPKSQITNITINNTGGTIKAGNKRYTGRFLSEDLVPTEFLYPTNPINIYSVDTNIPSLICGDAPDIITTKSVNMLVTDITPGIYKFFELVVIEHLEKSFTATIVQRYSLDPAANSIAVEHTEIGQDNIPLGANELLAIQSKYLKAENIRIFDNRIVFSNVTQQIDADLRTWASAITHSLQQKSIPALGMIVGANADGAPNLHEFVYDDTTTPRTAQPSIVPVNLHYNFNEYINPANVLNNTSYMYNDTYRFGIQVKWKETGKWSAPYWVDDIRFDNSSTNVTSPNRRTTSSITSNLTNEYCSLVYIYYVRFSNINLDQLVNGVPLRNLIDGFRFVRAERIPEVLSTGYFFLGDVDTASGTSHRKPYFIRNAGFKPDYVFQGATDVNATADTISNGSAHGFFNNEPLKFANPSPGGAGLLINYMYYVEVVNSTTFALREVPDGPRVNLTATGVNNTLQIGSEPVLHNITTNNGSDVLYYHSPDQYFIDRNYTFDVNTYSIKLLGPTKNILSVDLGDNTTGGKYYADLTGYFSSSARSYLTIDDTTVPALRDYALLDLNEKKTLPSAGLTAHNKNFLLNDVISLSTPLRQSVGSYFSAGLANAETNGIYYGQIFFDRGANKKYPANKELTDYQSIGHFYYLTASSTGTLNNIDVFGGDIFNQKTHLPIALITNNVAQNGTMIGCYSQNSINTQMMSYEEDPGDNSIGYRWPVYNNKNITNGPVLVQPNWVQSPLIAGENSIWIALNNFLNQTIQPQRFYNSAYDYVDRTIIEKGFNYNPNYNGELPSRVVWSSRKALGSFRDGYRLGFGVTEFADLDLTYGPIVHHEVINNSFYTLQPFSFQRQYFRDASLLGAQEGTDVVIGSGSILGSPGVELTSIGSEYKWSQLKGQTEGGKESFYWYNNRLKKMMRFGADGVRPISDRGVITLLQKNTNWLLDKKYPLSGIGIHGIWNDKYNEAIFTFKATNPNIAVWATATSYTIGTYVYVNAYVHSSGLPFAYKAKTNHTSSATTQPETGANWQANWTKIEPGTDAYAHTCLTLVYDELKNGFVATHSYWPDIYLGYQNSFWSPNPNAKNTLFFHDQNTDQRYYGTQYIPSITGVMNIEPNLSKNFEAIQVNSEFSPSGVDFFTKNHQSYLDETEWEAREGYYYSPIKNDILTAPLGTPVEDTSRLWGKWLKVKVYLESTGNVQRLVNFIIKFRPMPRLYNQ